ncbi:MAG: glycosyltransferase family 4 protein [Planctomycetes bacterium]|nr:glycosyltransferase family 4 protein [Planctomycetota bacterium]MCB9935007.1 glycosyltransferase family 4 protein [Planctomycetota bacterium]
MHIAIVRTEFVRTRGGAERYAVELARLWFGLGHRISIVCSRANPDDAAGMEVVKVSRPKVLGPYKHNWFAKRAGPAAHETGADAVLCLARAWPGDVLRLGDGLHQLWLEVRYGTDGARRRAMLNPRHRELLKLEAGLFEPGRFGLYVANSEMMRDEVLRRFGVGADRIKVVPNGVDWSRFHTGLRESRDEMREAHAITTGEKLVLFSGMDFRRKGLPEAVRGFIELAKGNAKARFVCVGPGYTKSAEEELRRAGLLDRSTFVGRTDDIAPWYAAADVFVLPTMHDPSSNAVSEALACGTPVITSRENGAKQHVRDGVNGWVLQDRGDARELAQRMAQLLENPPVPDSVVDASSLLSREVNAERMLEVLKQARAMRS